MNAELTESPTLNPSFTTDREDDTKRTESKGRKSSMNTTRQPGKRDTGKASGGFTNEERAAMRERAKEIKAAAGEDEVLAKIAEMPDPDRRLAERLHALITANTPELSPRTWYGMPAYAKDGAIVCHFQPAAKFKTRYAMLGFSDKAKLDDGTMWPAYFALMELTPADEEKVAALLKQAVS